MLGTSHYLEREDGSINERGFKSRPLITSKIPELDARHSTPERNISFSKNDLFLTPVRKETRVISRRNDPWLGMHGRHQLVQ